MVCVCVCVCVCMCGEKHLFAMASELMGECQRTAIGVGSLLLYSVQLILKSNQHFIPYHYLWLEYGTCLEMIGVRQLSWLI